ncbi:MAG: hypothetical protein ABWU13_25870, partial [Limnospira maxima]
GALKSTSSVRELLYSGHDSDYLPMMGIIWCVEIQPSPQTPLPIRERGIEKYLIRPGTAILWW